MSDKLQTLHADISEHLEQIAGLFKRTEGVKITIVIRTPKRDDGGVLLSDDDFDLAIAEIQRLRTQGEITGAVAKDCKSGKLVEKTSRDTEGE